MRTEAYVTLESLTARTEAWLARVRAAVAPRPHLVLHPERCALLVIDMLHYFADPAGRSFLPSAAAIVPRIAGLLQAWRGFGGQVIFTQHAHRGPEDLGMLGKFFGDYIHAGRPEAEILPTLAPIRGELCLRKTTYDGFLHTPLERALRAAASEQVLVTGVLTHMCCETTARAAFCRGFEVFVAADATATTSEERHIHSLLAMADAVAIVCSSQEVLARCPPARES